MPSFLLQNLFKLMVGFSPMFAMFVSRVKLDRKYFVVSELLFAAVTAFLFFDGLHWIPPFDLCIYQVFMMLNLAIFTFKFGREGFSRALAVSLLLTFIITEVWEFAAFVYGYLGWGGHSSLPILHPLNHIYVLVCFLLATKISGLRFTKLNVTILVTALLCSFLFFEPTAIFPIVSRGYNPQFFLMRTIAFSTFASVFYVWSGRNE